MKNLCRLALVPLLVLGGGCAERARSPATSDSAAAGALAPSSDQPVAQVYPGPSSPEWGTPSGAPPPAISALDLRVAEQVSRTLKTDPLLESISGNIQTTIQNGVLTLRGAVPTEHALDELTERLSRLPGVDRIDNKLDINLH